MSRRTWRSLLTGLAASAALAAACAGYAAAGSLDTLMQGALVPSAAPGLLGPITESGRVGWECKPEIAAAARTAQDADLPVVPRR